MLKSNVESANTGHHYCPSPLPITTPTTYASSSRSSMGENSPPAKSFDPGAGGKNKGDPLAPLPAPTTIVLSSIVVLQSDRSDVLE